MGKLMLSMAGTGVAILVTATSVSAETAPAKTIAFLGDSLSAGFGVKPAEAFPSLIEEKIRAANLPYQVENAGVSGDTTAGGLRRIDWLLQRPIDVLVIELGANDGLRGLPVTAIRSNLEKIIEKTRSKYPNVKVIVAGMQMPPNLGGDYAASFQKVFGEVAQANNATLIPFLLEGVGGMRELNQPDQIHPTAAGHRVIADLLWKTLEPLLRESR